MATGMLTEKLGKLDELLSSQDGVISNANPTGASSGIKGEVSDHPEETPAMGKLASHISRIFERNQRIRLPIEIQMLINRRQLDGIYEPDKTAAIAAQKGSSVYPLLTQEKSRDAKAWVNDIIGGENPFKIKPTPMPDLPGDTNDLIAKAAIQQVMAEEVSKAVAADQMGQAPLNIATVMQTVAGKVQQRADELAEEIQEAIQQKAEERAEKMQLVIEDVMAEGHWHRALLEAVYDAIDYPAGILKGPIYRMKKVKVWELDTSGKTPTWNFKDDMKLVREFDRIHPKDFYPSPGQKRCDDGGEIIEIKAQYPTQLQELIGVPGFRDDLIKQALEEFSGGSLKEWRGMSSSVAQIEILEAKENISMVRHEGQLELMEYHGNTKGELLLDWDEKMKGSDGKEIDKALYYPVMAWQVGNHVIKAIIKELGSTKSMYSSIAYERSSDSIWGKDVPQLTKPDQDMCAQACRAINNNVALASGPMVEYNESKMADGVGPRQIVPWMILRTKGKDFDNRPAVQFYAPPLIAQELIIIYDHFKQNASDATGIPAYGHGNGAQMASTAAGQSMIDRGSMRGIERFIDDICNNLVAPRLEYLYEDIMMFHADESIKGDCRVVITGVEATNARDQNIIRLNEFLVATNNPTDNIILGSEARSLVLQAVAKWLPGLNEDELERAIEKQASSLSSQQGGAAGMAPAGVPPTTPSNIPGVTQGMAPPPNSQPLDMAGQPMAGTAPRVLARGVQA
jgi:hypothetical protein